MSDYDKIMESIHGLIGAVVSIIIDIALLFILGALAITLILN